MTRIGLHVSALILENANGEVLIGQRRVGDTSQGKWEFPSGKIKQGESFEAALIREIKEELNLVIDEFTYFHEVSYAYPTKDVLVQFFYKKIPTTIEITPRVHQKLCWVLRKDLTKYDFLEANRQVLSRLYPYQD